MATAGEVLNVIQEVEAVSNSVLAEVSAIDPALELPAATIAAIEGLANTAMNAFVKAQGTPVSVAAAESVEPTPMPAEQPTV